MAESFGLRFLLRALFILAAKERRERKEVHPLCALCVLLRPESFCTTTSSEHPLPYAMDSAGKSVANNKYWPRMTQRGRWPQPIPLPRRAQRSRWPQPGRVNHEFTRIRLRWRRADLAMRGRLGSSLPARRASAAFSPGQEFRFRTSVLLSLFSSCSSCLRGRNFGCGKRRCWGPSLPTSWVAMAPRAKSVLTEMDPVCDHGCRGWGRYAPCGRPTHCHLKPPSLPGMKVPWIPGLPRP